MKVIKLSEALKSKEVADAIKSGKILIYPTDTIYGIGCNAEVAESVRRIHEAKARPGDKPFGVIAPSKEWIFDNTHISKENIAFVESLLPGPYMVILKAKRKIPFVTEKDGTIGIRIPKDPFCDLIRKQNILFITTSVNLSEDDPVRTIEEIPSQIKEIVDIAIDAGQSGIYGSRIFDLTKDFKIARF